VLSQRGAESVVLLSLTSGRYYSLEGVGARIWELCDGSRGAVEVAAAISSEFGAPLAEVEADLAELIDDLAQEELLAVGG
jgi:Coenzyme PQQ synthesis protein D (PqqD)